MLGFTVSIATLNCMQNTQMQYLVISFIGNRYLQYLKIWWDLESFVKGGLSLTDFFVLFFGLYFGFKCMRGGHFKQANIGQPAKRHLNGVLLAGRWWPNIECWLVSFEIFQGIRTSIAYKTYIFVIFLGGGGGTDPPVQPSGSAHVKYYCYCSKWIKLNRGEKEMNTS